MATPRKKPEDRVGKGRKLAWDLLDMPSKIGAVEGWTRQGATIPEIAKMLGVSEFLIYKWQRQKPQFKQALKNGRHVSDGQLLYTAFRQATGYTTTERQTVVDPATGELREVEVERYIPPHPTMMIFMLKNRLPNIYKDRHDHVVSGGINFNILQPGLPGQQGLPALQGTQGPQAMQLPGGRSGQQAQKALSGSVLDVLDIAADGDGGD